MLLDEVSLPARPVLSAHTAKEEENMEGPGNMKRAQGARFGVGECVRSGEGKLEGEY